MKILICLVSLAVLNYANSQVVESDVELHRGFNMREWIRRFYTKKVRNILSPLNQKASALERIMIKVEFDSQPFWLYFDTGSDLTWIPAVNISLPRDPNMTFSNYYTPLKAVRGGRFHESYGANESEMYAKGFEYTGLVRFSKSRRKINLTYGVADEADFNGVQYAGLFGASNTFRGSNHYPIIANPLTRRAIPQAVFTISLKPWTGFEPFEPYRHHMGNIEIGGLDPDHCYSRITYSPKADSGFWKALISQMQFGYTMTASAHSKSDSYVYPITMRKMWAALDSGSPIIGLPMDVYDILGIGDGSQSDLPRFHCNDTEFEVKFNFLIEGRWVKLDRRHLMFPEDDDGIYCSMKIVPARQMMLGLPFYAAAGCIIHDYEGKRTGIANLRPNNSSVRLGKIGKKNKLVQKLKLYR